MLSARLEASAADLLLPRLQPGSSMRRIKKSTEKFDGHINKRGTDATKSTVVRAAAAAAPAAARSCTQLLSSLAHTHMSSR